MAPEEKVIRLLEGDQGIQKCENYALNSKGEILPQLEEAAKAFQKDNPGITVEIQPVPTGGSPFERASALYASGNPPTMIMLDTGDVEKFKDRILDLSGEK